MTNKLAALACTLFAATATVRPAASAFAAAAQPGPGIDYDTAPKVLTLEPFADDWLFVQQLPLSTYSVSKFFLLDGNSGKMLGLIAGGFLANLKVSHDRTKFYVTETYYSRGSRGKRADVVTTYSAKTLLPLGEVDLPNGRMLAMPKAFSTSMTTDGRYLLSSNMRPSNSVSVVDVEAQTFVSEIPTPGCFLALPTGPRSFMSICSNGGLMTVDISDRTKMRNASVAPFFDPIKDPVFDTPARDVKRGSYYFLTYGGNVYRVDTSGRSPVVARTWKAAQPQDAAQNIQAATSVPIVYDERGDQLLVLFRNGVDTSHTLPGDIVRVFDRATGHLLGTWQLARPVTAIGVSPGPSRRLYALSGEGTLDVYAMTDQGQLEKSLAVEDLQGAMIGLITP
jgi:methylamine dehydrogenase heavy chain